MFLEREHIYQEVSGSHINLEEIWGMTDNELKVGTNSQLEVQIPVKSNDITLPLCRFSRVSENVEFYKSHLTAKSNMLVSDKTTDQFGQANSY